MKKNADNEKKNPSSVQLKQRSSKAYNLRMNQI